MNKTTLYQLKKTGKIWQWSCWANGDRVYTSYGYVDGAQQETHETAAAVNVGKSNEVSPVEQARLIAERKIKEKLESGYSRTAKDAKLEPEALDYNNLPKAFTPSKPISSIEDKKLRQLFDAGKLSVQRKHDGLCMIVVRGSDGIKILTRGKLEDKTEHFPHLVNELKGLPEGTIVVGELISKDFKTVTSIVRTKDAKEAINKQVFGPVKYMIFDVLHWASSDITSMPYKERMLTVVKWAESAFRKNEVSYFQLTYYTNLAIGNSYDTLFGNRNIAAANNWEGYVLWDLDAPTKIRLDGKEERTGAWKWKPILTEDLWLEEPTEGKGKNEGKLGQVKAYQYSPTGEKVLVCELGGGFSDAERSDFWKRRNTLFPCAAEAETPERLESGKLRFPVFIRLRPDKAERECSMQLEYKGE